MLHHHPSPPALRSLSLSSYTNISRWFNYCSSKEAIGTVASKTPLEEVRLLSPPTHTPSHISSSHTLPAHPHTHTHIPPHTHTHTLTSYPPCTPSHTLTSPTHTHTLTSSLFPHPHTLTSPPPSHTHTHTHTLPHSQR